MVKTISYQKEGSKVEKEIIFTSKNTISINVELENLRIRKNDLDEELIIVNKAINDLEKL